VERAIVFAGFGGQGLLFAGKVLAQAAMTEGREVFWIPSYGPEMRGGTAACTVIIGDEPIGSPIPDQADGAVVLNPPSLAKYGTMVGPGGLLVVNGSLCEAPDAPGPGVEVLVIPATEIAAACGGEGLASVVALGALVERRGIVSPESVLAALDAVVGLKHREILAADLEAFEAGRQAARIGETVSASTGDREPVSA
jgi:2-oxoglutarate ferredoxin oxidoreductase subunit gamma